MKDEDLFSNDGPPPTPSAQEPSRNSGGHAPSPSTLPQDTLSPARLPRMGRRLTRHPRMRLLLVALLVLIVVATGYGLFRAVSPPARRAPSAFQQAPCPFTLGQGL